MPYKRKLYGSLWVLGVCLLACNILIDPKPLSDRIVRNYLAYPALSSKEETNECIPEGLLAPAQPDRSEP